VNAAAAIWGRKLLSPRNLPCKSGWLRAPSGHHAHACVSVCACSSLAHRLQRSCNAMF
jgi:hypothetical protein